jgi:hypothetical protein
VVRAPSRLHVLAARFLGLSPYEVPELGVLRHGTAGQDPRRGARRREGVSPSPVRPSYRGPPCWQGGRPGRSPPWAYALTERMTTGRRRTRHGAMGSPHAAGGIRTPFPTLSPRGSPRGPFPRRPTSSPGSLQVECGRRRVSPPAPRLVPRQPGYSPGTRLTRQRGEVAASRPHVRPRHHPGSGSAPTLPRRPGRVKALAPKGPCA